MIACAYDDIGARRTKKILDKMEKLVGKTIRTRRIRDIVNAFTVVGNGSILDEIFFGKLDETETFFYRNNKQSKYADCLD